MTRRREMTQLFGMSFLDVLACALGAVVFLLMQTANRSHEQANVYDRKIAGLDIEVEGMKRQVDDALRDTNEANRGRDDAERAGTEAERERDEAEQGFRNAEARAQQAIQAQRVAEMSAAEAMAERDAAERARAVAEQRTTVAVTGQRMAETELGIARMGREDAENSAALTRRQRDDALAELTETRRQLADLRGVVGLKGKLRNVVFVFDTSGSLGASEFPSTADSREIERDRQQKLRQFEEYKRLLCGWVRALDFETFNIIEFNTAVHVWSAGELVHGTEQNRALVIVLIADWKPGGTTNTMGALEAALKLPGVDTIVLFSDGQPDHADGRPVYDVPSTQAERERSKAAVRRVLEGVARLNKGTDGSVKVTINSVALGNYFDKDYGRFLQEIARQSGGEFIGR